MSKAELAKRYILFIISLFFIGLGIAVTKHAGLGISPISSVANVFSIKFSFISFGTWIFISNMLFLTGQILLLRKNFKLVQLLQVPLSFLFGYFSDFGVYIASLFPNEAYISKIILIIVGSFVLAFGIAMSLAADVILNSAEGFVKALAFVLKKNFSNIKTAVDVCLVILSAILSMLFFGGKICGIREGTVISALTVGFFVKAVTPLLKKLERFLLV